MRHCLFIFILITANLSAQAAVYRCQQADGSTRYQETPCAKASQQHKQFTFKDYRETNESKQQKAVDNCLNYAQTQQGIELQAGQATFSWVAVQKLGARQMLELQVFATGPAMQGLTSQGPARPEQQPQGQAAAQTALPANAGRIQRCLLLGNGIDVNPYPYELVTDEQVAKRPRSIFIGDKNRNSEGPKALPGMGKNNDEYSDSESPSNEGAESNSQLQELKDKFSELFN